MGSVSGWVSRCIAAGSAAPLRPPLLSLSWSPLSSFFTLKNSEKYINMGIREGETPSRISILKNF